VVTIDIKSKRKLTSSEDFSLWMQTNSANAVQVAYNLHTLINRL